ncbi:MAG: peptidylprolyl isomerase [Lachnospiraceae bacterium]|nr:peptidylprolyl isomerase [Lachnospiraceae bacterium]
MKLIKGIGKKFCIGVLALGLSVGGLTACGENDSGTKVVFTTGFGKDEVFRIADESCSKSEMMVYLTNTQNQYENVYGAAIWNTSLDGVTLEENVKETVLAKIAQIKTMYLLALEKELALDSEEEERIKQAAAEYFQSLNEEEIRLMDVNLETIENLYREYAMADKVYNHTIQDVNPEISDDEARTITVQHIYIRTWTTDGSGTRIEYNDTARQAAYEKACEVRDMAVSGEYDFTELASKYSEDTNISYSFGKGEMDEAYEKAAFMLETDEISQVIETEVGYHIIKCLNTFNREETDANKLKIVEQRRNEAFGQEYDRFVETLVRNLNQSLWDEIELIHNNEVKTTNFFDIYAKYFPEQK